MKPWIPIMLAATLIASLALAGPLAAPAQNAACTETITLFHDVSIVGRKDRAARNITRRHTEMAAEGWQFKEMEVYTENGDLEGFFLSYTRARACP